MTVSRRRPGSLLPLEIAALRAVHDHGADWIHGFAVAQAIADAEESRRLTSTGVLYRALQRLDDAGLIENSWEDPDVAARAGRPRRRLYRLTGAGAAALAAVAVAGATRTTHRLNPRFTS